MALNSARKKESAWVPPSEDSSAPWRVVYLALGLVPSLVCDLVGKTVTDSVTRWAAARVALMALNSAGKKESAWVPPSDDYSAPWRVAYSALSLVPSLVCDLVGKTVTDSTARSAIVRGVTTALHSARKKVSVWFHLSEECLAPWRGVVYSALGLVPPLVCDLVEKMVTDSMARSAIVRGVTTALHSARKKVSVCFHLSEECLAPWRVVYSALGLVPLLVCDLVEKMVTDSMARSAIVRDVTTALHSERWKVRATVGVWGSRWEHGMASELVSGWVSRWGCCLAKSTVTGSAVGLETRISNAKVVLTALHSESRKTKGIADGSANYWVSQMANSLDAK